jgi:F-type H+-transporting ATPase subunit gamma
MTRRRELQRRRHSIIEIGEIMNSMKTLAYMETHKLDRFLNAQCAVVAQIEAVAEDFLAFFPGTLPKPDKSTSLFLLLGSERGFCGDFNESLLVNLENYLRENSIHNPQLMAVGRKLYVHMDNDPRLAVSLEGADVVEEVERVLNQIIIHLTESQKNQHALSLTVLYNDLDCEQVVIKEIFPPFENLTGARPRFTHPPLIHVSPMPLLAELIDHYLFAILHKIMYVSLMAENVRRMRHLEGAVHHLDDKAAELLRESNALRQEEIIEEIEVILLSGASYNVN